MPRHSGEQTAASGGAAARGRWRAEVRLRADSSERRCSGERTTASKGAATRERQRAEVQRPSGLQRAKMLLRECCVQRRCYGEQTVASGDAAATGKRLAASGGAVEMTIFAAELTILSQGNRTRN
jgi:hypothetical protein